ncbi:MAG: amidohydrolase family protein [Nitrospinota bacterium]|nr:amidohydrolase family protein [Nitrospinota bacterium]
MADILIKNGTLITMDPERRVIEKGAVAVEKDRIVAVGTARQVAREHKARKVIDARGKVVMPGLIDAYGNSGTALTKNIAERTAGHPWRLLLDHILFRSVTEDFWYVEGKMMALEHLKFGTTCFMNMFGNAPRGDDPVYPEANMRGIAEVGLRSVTGLGPARPPYPTIYSSWKKGKRTDRRVPMRESFRVAEKVIRKCNGTNGGLTNVWVGVSRLQGPSRADPMFRPEYVKYARQQVKPIRRLMETYGVGLRANAYGGVIKWCQEELKILGPKVLLAHCTDLSKKEIRYLRDTDAKVVHCPTARRIFSYKGACPVVELIEAGVTVSLGTDYTGQDRTGDQFRDLKVAMLLQRLRFRDPSVLPPGKVLEMVTIDAARCLGMEGLIGSLEAGKKADITLMNMMQPHLVPAWMVPQRVAYQVTGHDVDTVLVNGRILMEGRKVKSVNEKKILREAQREGKLMVERSGVAPFMGIPDRFWNHSRY